MSNHRGHVLLNSLHKAFMVVHSEHTLHHRVQPTLNHTRLQPVIQVLAYLPLLLEFQKRHTCFDGSLQLMHHGCVFSLRHTFSYLCSNGLVFAHCGCVHCWHRLCHFTLHTMHLFLYHGQTRIGGMNVTLSLHMFLWQLARRRRYRNRNRVNGGR